ncbi:Uncharacterised protein [Yersinia pseudotuberculosis]|nr:Uncharacterised protein [Yersinia pseudotuberculosis]
MNTLMKASHQAITAARETRKAIRRGYDKPTAGMVLGMTQANMICRFSPLRALCQ